RRPDQPVRALDARDLVAGPAPVLDDQLLAQVGAPAPHDPGRRRAGVGVAGGEGDEDDEREREHAACSHCVLPSRGTRRDGARRSRAASQVKNRAAPATTYNAPATPHMITPASCWSESDRY